MPVETVDVIDFVSHHPETKEVMLEMVETRDWNAMPQAVQQLDAKLNSYAEYVLSDALTRQFPDFAKYRVFIRLNHFTPINEAVAEVLRQWAGRLSGIPVGIRSHRMYWNPIVTGFRKLAARCFGARYDDVIWTSDSKSTAPLLTAAQFAEEFAEAMRRVKPAFQIKVVENLELNVIAANGHESHGFLNNAYNSYRVRPENKSDIIQKYIVGFLESIEKESASIDKSRIVPILKDRAWIQEVNENVGAKAGGKTFDAVHETYNDELIVVYAEDAPSNIRYLTPENLVSLNLETHSLLKLACENLQNVISNPELRLEDGVYRICAGGDYDASLLLLDAFWEKAGLQVDGEIVAAAPARDFLMATGSKNESGMRKIKALAQMVASKAPYRLTSTLFVRRGGRFVSYEAQA